MSGDDLVSFLLGPTATGNIRPSRETSGASGNDLLSAVLGPNKPPEPSYISHDDALITRMLGGHKYRVEEEVGDVENIDLTAQPTADYEAVEDGSDEQDPGDVLDFEYDSYENPLAIVSQNTLLATEANLKERMLWAQLNSGSYEKLFPGRKDDISRHLLKLGKIVGVDHLVRAYLYPNTLAVQDRYGEFNLDGFSLVVTGDTPLQALRFVHWGEHRAYVIDCVSKEGALKTAHNFAGDHGTAYLASSKVAVIDAISQPDLKNKPILAYDGRVAYGNVISERTMRATLVVTNYSERILHQIDLLLQQNPRMTVEQFFHSQAYVSAITHGQAETLGVMHAAMNAVKSDAIIKTGMPYACVKPLFIAPTHYIRRISPWSIQHGRISSASASTSDDAYYQIYVNMFGDTNNMLPDFFTSSHGHNVPTAKRAFIVDNGTDHGFTIHSERSIDLPLWATKARLADLELLMGDQVMQERIQEVDSNVVVGSGLPTHGFFNSMSDSVSAGTVQRMWSGLLAPHQATRAYRFDDNNPNSDPLDVQYSEEMRRFYSSFHTNTTISPSSVYVEGINPGMCSLEKIVAMNSRGVKISIPLSNIETSKQLVLLALMACQEMPRSSRTKSVQEPELVLGVKQVKFDGVNFTVDHAWLKQAYETHKDHLPKTSTPAWTHLHPHIRAYSAAHQFLHHQEPANMTLLMSEMMD